MSQYYPNLLPAGAPSIVAPAEVCTCTNTETDTSTEYVVCTECKSDTECDCNSDCSEIAESDCNLHEDEADFCPSTEVICTETGCIATDTDLTIINQPSCCLGKNATAEWAARIAGVNNDVGTDVVIDSCGNVIVIGYYRNNTGSDPPFTPPFLPPPVAPVSPLDAVTQVFDANDVAQLSLPNSGQDDVFIAKYGPEGQVLWAAKIAGVDSDIGYGVAVDAADNIIVVGAFNSTSLLVYNSDLQPVLTLLASEVASFVVKYSPAGNVCWGTTIRSSAIVQAFDVTTDMLCNIIVVGYYLGTNLTFYNPDGTISSTLPASNGEDAFIAKYNPGGLVTWTTRIGDSTAPPGNERAFGVKTGSDNSVVIVGYYSGSTAILYNAPNGSVPSGFQLENTVSIDDMPNIDAFVVKYNADGSAQWATRIAGQGQQGATAVTIDRCNDIIVTGYYTGNPILFYNTPNGTLLSGWQLGNSDPTSVTTDVFVAKYNAIGMALFATRIGGVNTEESNSIAVDVDNNFVVTGSYSSQPVTFYNTDGTTGPQLVQSGITDAFVVKYNVNGCPLWATKLANAGNENGLGIAIDPRCNSGSSIVVTGYYTSNPLNIFNSAGSVDKILRNSGGSDVFVVKYADFCQNLSLGPALCKTQYKTIMLKQTNRTNTFIFLANGLVFDNGRPVRGVLLNGAGAAISLEWCCNQWQVIERRYVSLIYY